MQAHYVTALTAKQLPPTVGNKAQNLHYLLKTGVRVPETYICTWEAYEHYLCDDPGLIPLLQAELGQVLKPGQAYAVRSSANIEDAFEHSFAGQFKTYLNIQGVDHVLTCIWGVWSNAQAQSSQVYLKKKLSDPNKLRMAVIVQRMVNPVLSGVAFSKNPMTGLDEVVVEAVRGSGEALVQEGVTPFRWIYKQGEWLVKPEEEGLQLDLIREVATQTRQISKSFHKAVDLEWVFDGRELYWVQLRDINSIRKVPIYSNRISKEMMPGIIKPLIFSVNVPMVVGDKILLITEITGRKDIDKDSLVKSFYYRTYFNMEEFGKVFQSLGMPEDSLEMMMGMNKSPGQKNWFKPGPKILLLLPRLIPFLIDKITFGRKIERFLAQAPARYKEFDSPQVGQLSEPELIATIDHLFALNQETSYYNFFTPLLSSIHNAMLRRACRRAGLDSDAFDPINELEGYNPNQSLHRLNRQYHQLPLGAQEAILAGDYFQFLKVPGIETFQKDVAAFLERFGHLSDSTNDFSAVPWRETPEIILKMIAYFPETSKPSVNRAKLEDAPLKGYRRWRFSNQYQRTARFRFYREQVGYTYTYGYGLFRVYFLALADHLLQREIIQARDDIFYLTHDELRAAVADPQIGCDYAKRVAQRKLDIELCQDMVLPELIYGDQAPPLFSLESRKLNGTPTSRGTYTGPTRIIHGIQDLAKVKDGDVLVVPFSDVGWTPLFARAGAVIAESGGMLSHSSIIAREYGIPAVVSVSGALSLPDDTCVTVDGFTGEITVHNFQEPVLVGGTNGCTGSQIPAKAV